MATNTTTSAQVTSALSGISNPASLRAALLRKLSIAPGRLTGMTDSSNFDANISNLYKSGTEQNASLDTQEGDIGATYAKNLAQSSVDQDKALRNLAESYAARGLTFSGLHDQDVSDTLTNYTKYNQGLDATRSTALNKISAAREKLLSDLASGQTTYEGKYGQTVADWLKGQAVAATPTDTGASGTPDNPYDPNPGPSAADIQAWVDATNANIWNAEIARQQAAAAANSRANRRARNTTRSSIQRAGQGSLADYLNAANSAGVTGLGGSGFTPGYRGAQ